MVLIAVLFFQVWSINLNNLRNQKELKSSQKEKQENRKWHYGRHIIVVRSLISLMVILTERKYYLKRTAKTKNHRKMRLLNLFYIHHSVVWKSKRVSLSKAAEEVWGNFKNEKVILTEVKLMFNHYNYNQTKPTEIQHRQNVFVYDIELYPDEESSACIPYSDKMSKHTKGKRKNDSKN